MNDELFMEDFNDDKARALSNYLGVDVDYIGGNEYNADGATYEVLTNDEAHDALLDLERSLLSDLGINSFSDEFKKRILSDPSLFDTGVVDEIIDSEVEYFTNEEPNIDVVEALSNMSELEKVSYVKDLLGDAGFEELVSDNINVEAVTDIIISEDGFGILATYDGDELELENDFLAFRVS